MGGTTTYVAYNRMKFEKVIGVEGAAGFKPGQDEATTVEQLLNYYPTRLYDDATLLQMGQLVDPTYNITEQDQAQRQARRELSERARINLFKMVHKRISFMVDGKLPRGLDMLVDFSDGPGAEEHNKRIMENFKSLDQGSSYVGGSIEERTKIMEEFIDRMDSIDYSALYTISDEKLAEEFPKLLPLYLLSVEGGDKLSDLNWNEKTNPTSPHYKLSPEYAERLKRYKQEYQGLMSYLKNRFDVIINPNYELLHIERMVPVDGDHQPDDVYFDKSNPIGLRTQGDGDDLAADRDLETFADAVGSAIQFRPYAWPDKVTNFAKTKGLDPKDIQIIRPDGEKIDAMQLEGVSMFTAIDGKSGREFLLQSDGTNLTEISASKALSAAKKGSDSVVKALEDADPWNLRLFAGSKEYAAMKKQMKVVDETMKKLEKPVSEKEYKAARALLDELLDKSNEYLGNKDILKENLKDSERIRIVAAKRVKEYAENKALLLDTDRKWTLERENWRNANNEDIKKQAKEEALFERPRVFTDPVNAASPEPTHIMNHYLGKMGADDPLRSLGMDISTSLIQAGANKDTMQLMAKMVAFDLVMRERKANGGKEIGVVETQYKKNPEDFIKGVGKSSALQNVAKNINAADFRGFVNAIIGNGVQKLTDKFLEEQKAQMQKSQQQVQPNLQKQVSVVKPSQNALGNK